MAQCLICGGQADKGWETCSCCDQRQLQEPDIVQCCKCGESMWGDAENPLENICQNCCERKEVEL